MPRPVTRNIDVVVYVLGQLGGATRKVSTEQIAHRCFELAPDRFAWIGGQYKHLPDKYVAKTALEDAAKAEYGRLVKGKYARDASKDGWILTPEGVRWFDDSAKPLAKVLEGALDAPAGMPPIERKRFLSRMKNDQAFASYSVDKTVEGVTRYMFADLLQASPDAPPAVLRAKFDRLLSQAELAKDRNVLDFLELCERRFFDDDGAEREK